MIKRSKPLLVLAVTGCLPGFVAHAATAEATNTPEGERQV